MGDQYSTPTAAENLASDRRRLLRNIVGVGALGVAGLLLGDRLPTVTAVGDCIPNTTVSGADPAELALLTILIMDQTDQDLEDQMQVALDMMQVKQSLREKLDQLDEALAYCAGIPELNAYIISIRKRLNALLEKLNSK